MLEILVLLGLAVAFIVAAGIAVLGVLVGLVVLPFKLLGAALGGAFELLLLPLKLVLALALGMILLAMGGCLLVLA